MATKSYQSIRGTEPKKKNPATIRDYMPSVTSKPSRTTIKPAQTSAPARGGYALTRGMVEERKAQKVPAGSLPVSKTITRNTVKKK